MTLDIDKEKKSCFILDAAGDIRQERFLALSTFIQDIDRVTYVKTENVPHPDDSARTIRTILQCDSHSCSIFALDHAKQIASLKDIHEQIKETSSGEEEAIHFIKWTDLPPEMVKNAQSTNVLKWYNENNAECAEKLNALTGNNKKNHGFEEARKNITQEAHKLCDEKSESEIKAMIESTEIKEGQSQLTFNSNSVPESSEASKRFI